MIGGTNVAGVDGSFVPAHAPDVVAVDADGEAVLVHEGTDHLHLLNATSALLWACFDGASSIAEICFDIADHLGVPFEQVLADTVAVVGGFLEQGLVRDGAAAPPHPHGGGPHGERERQDVPRRPRLLDEPPSG